MAVSALELRPRSSVELLDAALRLGGRSSGAWLLTLPGALALCTALVVFLEAAEKGGAFGPSMWLLGLAWCLRALGQGAACHHLEQQLLAPEPALPGASVRAALFRAPSLLFTATVLGPLSLGWAVMTLGVGHLLWASPLVIHAVAMQRRGRLFGLWREASTALGASRALAVRVRWLLPFQVLLLINLHVAVTFTLTLARSLFGLDVAQLSRMAALDNPGWWLLLGVLTFAMLEPIRAATAVLLLVDGRVRREGMDLHARLAALPAPRATLGTTSPAQRLGSVQKVAVLVGLMLLPLQVSAETPMAPAPSPELHRLDALVGRCTGTGLGAADAEVLRSWTRPGSLTLSRWVSRLEREADTAGCERAMQAISRDLAALSTSAQPASPPARTDEAVREILSRSEFEQRASTAGQASEDSPFLAWLKRLLERLFENDDAPTERPEPRPARSFGSGLDLSQLLLWILPIVALLTVLWALRRKQGSRRASRDTRAGDAVSDAASVEAPASALSQAPRTWLELADGLAAEGRHREAIRSAYLATLAGLHHQGRIRYDPHHSNWDHLMGFQGEGSARAIFRELTLRFDRAWYGVGDVDATTWQHVRGHTVRLIGHDLELEAAGA